MNVTNRDKKYHGIRRDRNKLRSERLRSARLASTITSVSSNAKWFKIFDSLQDQLAKEANSIVKLLNQDEPWEYNNILSSVFEETYLDGMLGTLVYSELEWLEIVCNKPPEFEFEVDMEVGESFVVIYGYRVSES